MDKVINDITNLARSIVEAVILATPAPGSPPYWALIGALLALVALLFIWLLLRLVGAGRIKSAPVNDEPNITFMDVSAQTAAEAKAAALAHGDKDDVVPLQDIAAAPTGEASTDAPVASNDAQLASGFTFFKKRSAAEASRTETANLEDDVFLLGLEQEMLATRQLYLDGLISKEVYVTETRALYDKAQTRMT